MNQVLVHRYEVGDRVLVHRYEIGSPDEQVTAIEAVTLCAACSQEIVPLLGKVIDGTSVDHTLWITGNYEHVERPPFPHPPVSS